MVGVNFVYTKNGLHYIHMFVFVCVLVCVWVYVCLSLSVESQTRSVILIIHGKSNDNQYMYTNQPFLSVLVYM